MYTHTHTHINNVTVSYFFNLFQVTVCVKLPDDSDIIAETCSRNKNCTVVRAVYTYVGFENKTQLPISI